jgi:hypothetical protein
MATDIRISIVVVTWECAPALARLVDSMNEQLDGSQELVVVDNASGDEPDAAAAAWRGRGWFMRLAYNHGFGAAVNAGVARAEGEAVVILNPDTELVDDGLPRLAAEALALRALVGPRILNRDGTIQPSASGPPVGLWPWVRAVLPSPIGPRWVKARTAPWRLASRSRVAWLAGSCIAAPRELLVALGPFDARIHLYGEDLDLGLRARARGVPSYISPGVCELIHDGKVATAQRSGDLGRGLAAASGRAVLRRRYGAGPERRAHRADRANLRLRGLAKRVLRVNREWDALVLAGLEAVGEPPELGSPVLTAPEVAAARPLR